jgi:hypothetical protein
VHPCGQNPIGNDGYHASDEKLGGKCSEGRGQSVWRPAKTCGVTVSDAWRGKLSVDGGITTTSSFLSFLFLSIPLEL